MQKITQIDITKYFIHKLGGYTKQDFKDTYTSELTQSYTHGYNNGYKSAITSIKSHTDKIYGCSKQEWIDSVYKLINNNAVYLK